ncbi:hypothetical protein HAX54_046503 [Datura stramonium]|uniref:Uncharacterized protein n=1 Tax=Datura stramonium TaxID=4076 RepID=A0ABS8WJ52_DATST|nr:hypothetical protein [Datura stramonium]
MGSETMRGDVLKAKMLRFKDSLRWQGEIILWSKTEQYWGPSGFLEAHVPILAEIDFETYAIKNNDLEKSKNETWYDLKLHKSVIEVFGPYGPSATIAEATTDLGEAVVGTKSVGHA